MQKEKRLIDAGALLKTINDTAEGLADCDQQNAAWALRKYAVRDIMDAQTVNAVEESVFREALEEERQKVRRLEDELRKTRSEREYFRSRSDFFSEVAAASGKVITVEGYKAFRGSMRICPRGTEPYELCGDWLYKPDTGCWYGKGRSFPADVCTILEVN